MRSLKLAAAIAALALVAVLLAGHAIGQPNHQRTPNYIAQHTNAVLRHKCLRTYRHLGGSLQTWLRRHREAHRARRGSCVPPIPHRPSWACIHRYEGSWRDSGDPYWGGLQMDRGFMATYGADFERRFGGYANRWPVWAQMEAAERAYRGVDWRGSPWPGPRGFTPWPKTARFCGLL